MKQPPPPNLDALLESELDKVRKAVAAIENGRSQLAAYLNVRLSEVSRYLTTPAGRKPSGPILLGMQKFVAYHTKPKASRKAPVFRSGKMDDGGATGRDT